MSDLEEPLERAFIRAARGSPVRRLRRATGPPATIGRMTYDEAEGHLEQNSFQMVGTARKLAKARGHRSKKGFERRDHRLAVALWLEALLNDSGLPPEPEKRALTKAESAFVERFLP